MVDTPIHQRAPKSRGHLEVGLVVPLVVREENIPHRSNVAHKRLCYASDLHLSPRRAKLLTSQLLDAISRARPDAVVLGGDLVDVRSALSSLTLLIERIIGSGIAVAAVPGNHDERVGLSGVRAAVLTGGGVWLPDKPLILNSASPVALYGALSADLNPKHFNVLCAHDPVTFPRAVRAGFQLVLAGHLHGGQAVLMQIGEREYPGALLSRWNGPRFARGKSLMLVSRGAADTLPLRWNCPREIIVCEV